MILVIDVGNTNIVLGIYQNDRLLQHWRISTNRSATSDEYGILIDNLFRHAGLSLQSTEGVIISSVVPPLMFAMEQMCERYVKKTPIIVGPGIKTGLNVRFENPKEVGADRIVNAAAAIELYGAPCIIVDFGTAMTFDYIDPAGQYIGGAAAPGIGISTEALYQRAAKLPRIELLKPKNVIGKNTVASMQAGIIYGFAGQVDGITERMMKEAKTKPVIIATGEMAELIAAESKMIEKVDPLLTLYGLLLIYKRNQ